MTKTQIENRIAEIDTMIEMIDKVEAENNETYGRAQTEFYYELLEHLKDAGFMVNGLTRISVYGGWGDTPREATVTFQNKERGPDFNVQFEDGKVTRFSASGCSSSGKEIGDDIAEIASYYGMVSSVMKSLTDQYFTTNTALFFDLLKNWKSPELKRVPNKNDLSVEKDRLLNELKVLDIDLSDGAAVQFGKWTGGNRYGRKYWSDYTVEKTTAKTVVLVDRWGDRKIVKREDVIHSIRTPQAS